MRYTDTFEMKKLKVKKTTKLHHYYNIMCFCFEINIEFNVMNKLM